MLGASKALQPRRESIAFGRSEALTLAEIFLLLYFFVFANMGSILL